jgi:pantoate--beta-alanine ligase
MTRHIWRQAYFGSKLGRRRQPSWFTIFKYGSRHYSFSTESNQYLSNTQIFRNVPEMRTFRRDLLLSNRTVGLVPTMGALHEGHISLARMAAQENTDVIISIYVNPTQFGMTEDLSTYPRTWDADMQALARLDAELQHKGEGRITAIFAPSTKVMYPTLPPSSELNGPGSFVTITPLGSILEGASRPVFFRGVATVCMKLFNAVQPDRVYFGQKDFQQTAIIRRLIADFHLPIEFRMGATVRESDGLAMSSRNVYLGSRRRKAALGLSQALTAAAQAYDNGATRVADIRGVAMKYLKQQEETQAKLPKSAQALFKADYVSVADPDTLDEIDDVDIQKGAVISSAIIMQPLEEKQDGEQLGIGGDSGTVRLIDNILLAPKV